jgi:hypothetical protein
MNAYTMEVLANWSLSWSSQKEMNHRCIPTQYYRNADNQGTQEEKWMAESLKEGTGEPHHNWNL